MRATLVITCALFFAACGGTNQKPVGPSSDGTPMGSSGDLGSVTSDLGANPDLGRPTRPGADGGVLADGGSGGARIACGSASCSGADLCCIDVTTGQAASMTCEAKASCTGIQAACTQPSDCSGGVCCANIQLTTTSSSLQVTGGTAACQTSASCAANVVLTGNSSGVLLSTRLCGQTSDCAGYSGMTPFGAQTFDGCCARPEAPSTHFCAPASFASSFGYTCL